MHSNFNDNSDFLAERREMLRWLFNNNSHSMEICRMAWHSPKIIFLKMGPNNVIESGESENRGPGARARVVYAVVNVVL